jgi:hypothetical protein
VRNVGATASYRVLFSKELLEVTRLEDSSVPLAFHNPTEIGPSFGSAKILSKTPRPVTEMFAAGLKVQPAVPVT